MNTKISVFCYELKLLLRKHNAGADEVAWRIKYLMYEHQEKEFRSSIQTQKLGGGMHLKPQSWEVERGKPSWRASRAEMVSKLQIQ